VTLPTTMNRTERKAWRESRKSAGLCIQCERMRVSKNHCLFHMVRNTVNKKRWYHRNMAGYRTSSQWITKFANKTLISPKPTITSLPGGGVKVEHP
jgi:hypothetical protein